MYTALFMLPPWPWPRGFGGHQGPIRQLVVHCVQAKEVQTEAVAEVRATPGELSSSPSEAPDPTLQVTAAKACLQAVQ